MATAREMLDLYTTAEANVLKGQRVRFGDRELTRANLEEIRAGRREWQARVDAEARRGRSGWAVADFGGMT
ncbi:primosomal replication protein PriB/PriC domain protein [Lysobacteraceae bacterium NML93-0399]|nr:primosomal replication protein PriB/PriC domain protein [Xanthomonadaceae bacterium NML93-0399]